MGYALLWIENLTLWLLVIAWAVAVAVRLRRRWLGGLLIAIAVGAPALLWGAAAGFLAYLESKMRIPTALVTAVAALCLATLAGGAIVAARGLRYDRDKQVRAHGWRPGWLGLAAGAVLLTHCMTFWNLDLAIRQELESLRVEAGALALAGSPPQVADRENAALLYQQAFEAGLLDERMYAPGVLDKNPEAYEDWLAATSETPATFNADDPEFTAYIARQAPLLDLVRQAAALSECSFSRDWGRPSWSMLLPEVQNMRSAACDLQLEAHYRAGHGDMRGALENVLAMHQMSEHVGQEPLLVCMLVSFALDAMAAENLENLLQQYPATSEDLAVLDAWRHTPAAPRMQRAFRMEEAFGLATFGQVAEWRDNQQAQILGLRGWTASTIPLYRVFFLREDLRSYRQATERLKNVGAMPYRERQKQLSEIESSFNAMPMGVLTSMLLPAIAGVDVAAAEAEARQRLAHVAVAAHRYRLAHGEFPASVDELASSGAAVLTRDPFADGPVRLIRRDASVILYSIGPNLTDDGGIASDISNEGDLTFTLKAPPASDADEPTTP